MAGARLKKAAVWSLRLGLGLGLWLWLFCLCDAEEFKHIWHTLSWRPLALATACSIGGVCFSAWPWRLLLKPLQLNIPWKQAVSLSTMGFSVNNLVPGGLGGDALRAWIVGKSCGNLEKAIATVLLDRWLSFVCLMSMAYACIACKWRALVAVDLGSAMVGVLLVLAAMLLVSLLLFAGHLPLSRKLLGRFTLGVPVLKLSEIMWSYSRRLRLMALCYLLTLSTPFLDAWVFYLISQSLQLQQPFWVYLLMVPVMRVIHHIPVSVNAVGTQDAACAFYLGAFGVGLPQALTISMAMHLIKLSVAAICGGTYLLTAQSLAQVAAIDLEAQNALKASQNIVTERQ